MGERASPTAFLHIFGTNLRPDSVYLNNRETSARHGRFQNADTVPQSFTVREKNNGRPLQSFAFTPAESLRPLNDSKGGNGESGNVKFLRILKDVTTNATQGFRLFP